MIDIASSIEGQVAGLPHLAPAEAIDSYHRLQLERWSDQRLIVAAGAQLASPKVEPADSFVLHAPLELLARARLLRYVGPDDREAARQRLVWLSASYGAAGDELGDPHPLDDTTADQSPDATAEALVAAITAGDLERADALAAALGDRATPAELGRLLGPAVVASLAAAAHASILLYLWPRSAASGVPGGLLRGPVHELARYPDWRLHWIEQGSPGARSSGSTLVEALAEVPMLGVPGSPFIFPVMSQVDQSVEVTNGLRGALGPALDHRQAARELARVAAWSMLHESDEHAPYGWTHCLTMPQAVMGLAGNGVDPQLATAVAATHVAGFRAALAQGPLIAGYEPPASKTFGVERLDEALGAGPEAAAAFAWHAAPGQRPDLVGTLAGRASRHHDAHLVKYTLACFDAAAADPSHERLFLAAAASLSAYWAGRPGDELFD